MLVPGFNGPRPMLAADAIAFSRNSREFNSRDVSLRGTRGGQDIGDDSGRAKDYGQHDLDHGDVAAGAAEAGEGAGTTGRERYVFSDDEGGRSRMPRVGGGGRGARSSDEATRKKALATSLYWCVQLCVPLGSSVCAFRVLRVSSIMTRLCPSRTDIDLSTLISCIPLLPQRLEQHIRTNKLKFTTLTDQIGQAADQPDLVNEVRAKRSLVDEVRTLELSSILSIEMTRLRVRIC